MLPIRKVQLLHVNMQFAEVLACASASDHLAWLLPACEEQPNRC